MSKIFVINGPEGGRSFELKGDINYLGRAPENDIRLNDRSVSRKHLQIIRKSGTFFVKDLKATNGTFVNGERIPPGIEFEIQEGQPIAVGNIFFSVGKAYEGDDQRVMDLIDLSKELREKGEVVQKDRPMTLQKNMELISKVSDILARSLTLNEILENLLNSVFELLERIDRGVIILVDPETRKVTEVIPRFKKSSDDTVMMYSRTIVDRVLKEGKAVSMSDTVKEKDLSESMEIMKIRSVMCVPLISRSRIRGLLYVDSVNRPHGFRRDDLALLSALASPAAVAVENALLHSSLEKFDGDKTRGI